MTNDILNDITLTNTNNDEIMVNEETSGKTNKGVSQHTISTDISLLKTDEMGS